VRSDAGSVASTAASAVHTRPSVPVTVIAPSSVTAAARASVWNLTPLPSRYRRNGFHRATSKFAFATSKIRPSLEPRK